MITSLKTCVLCGVQYDAPVHLRGYQGLCPSCWSKDTLREWDRLESAHKRLLPGAPDALTLAEWLAIVARWRGLCALCEINQFGVLAIWFPVDGLVAGNVAPLCRACEHHRQNSFSLAIDRVSAQLDAHLV